MFVLNTRCANKYYETVSTVFSGTLRFLFAPRVSCISMEQRQKSNYLNKC